MPIISRRRSVGLSGPGVPVATHLAFTTPPGLSGASPYTLSPQPVVAAQNGSNTTDTTYAGTVTITLNVLTGSPVLSGTTTKALVSGVADFSGNALAVTGAGTWTLTATLSPLTSATSSAGTTTAGVQFADDFSGTLAQWTTTLVGTGAVVDIVSGALRVGTTTGSFSTVNAQAKTTNAFILGDAGVHDVIIDWTAATNQDNGSTDLWVVDGSGNGFGIQTMNGPSSAFSLRSVTVAASVASSGIAFLAVGAVNSPVTATAAPLYLRFSQNGTNWAIAYSTNGTSWTPWTSGTLVSANNPVTSAMKLVVIGHANGGNGTATESRWDNVTWK